MALDTTGGDTGLPKAKKPSNLVKALAYIAMAIGFGGGWVLTNYVSASWHDYSVDQLLAQTCADLNKKTPKMVDEMTQLDGVSTPGHHRIVYHYTVTPPPNLTLNISKVEDIMKPIVLKAYRTNPELKTFRDNGVIMEYDYSDASGHKLTQFEVGPSDLN